VQVAREQTAKTMDCWPSRTVWSQTLNTVPACALITACQRKTKRNVNRTKTNKKNWASAS
jgi:hypothetical protein